MKELIEMIAKALVDSPDEVVVGEDFQRLEAEFPELALESLDELSFEKLFSRGGGRDPIS